MKINIVSFVIVFFFLSLKLSAQPAPPPSRNQPAPLGGVVLLAAAGVALGIAKKSKDS